MEFSPIKFIEECGEEEVWDISFYENKNKFYQEEANFIANNIILHNSHASGVVVSNVPMDEIVPARPMERGLTTQFTMEEIESLGLIKFDFLGLSTMSAVDEAVKMIKENYGIDIDIYNMDVDDQETFDLYKSGNLTGVFQCEEHGMQRTMKELAPTSFDDIMAAVALYRPGPKEFIPQYCARKRGEQRVDYFHPSIEKYVKQYLEKTHGIIVYQEQIMQICNVLAGFSQTEGYVMIKAVGKKKEHLLTRQKDDFKKGCVRNDVPIEVADSYWEKCIIPFANYGFNQCLDGSMMVKDKTSGDMIRIDELAETYDGDKNKIILDSCVDGEIAEDELVKVFETGEKEVYEIALDNGVVLKCTLDHKFLCSDKEMHTVREIMDNDLEIKSNDIGKNMKKCKIKSIKSLGKKKTYNLTMKSDQHNYAVYGGDTDDFVISANSHACSYGLLSYITAYLKVHYPEEMMVALLNVENRRKKHEKVEEYEHSLSRCNIKLLPKSINDCGVKYKIVKKANKSVGEKFSEISPSLVVKGVGEDVARAIEENQPYKDFRDLIVKTKKQVGKKAVDNLYDGGFFNKLKKGKKKITKEELLTTFENIRDDLEAAARRGIESQDLFA